MTPVIPKTLGFTVNFQHFFTAFSTSFFHYVSIICMCVWTTTALSFLEQFVHQVTEASTVNQA